jgi:hypothetical protein
MRRKFVVAPLLAVLFLARTPAIQAAAPDADIDAGQVRKSIERGVAFLKSKQDQNGNWPEHLNQVGGVTALCTLALLNCGVPADDDSVQRALRYLRTLKPSTTYVMSLQTMAFCLAEPRKDLLTIQKNAEWLEEQQIKQGANSGAWAYPNIGTGDNSNSQFALLALYEAERAGATVNNATWNRALHYWKDAQSPVDGSFAYLPPANGAPGTGSMTCAGISSLVIASGRTSAGDATVDGDQVSCCGNHGGDDSDQRIERALHWLGRPDVFTVQQNPTLFQMAGLGMGRELPWHYYYLYGLERVGRMTARRFIGAHDWYREGAAFLCSAAVQRDDGSWKGSNVGENDPVIASSFALLFLGKGRRPILISKLQHGPGADWNHHRNDVANLTGYVETKWKKEYPLGMTWQVIDLAKATVEDLQQTPVLFINGAEAPDIDDKHAQMLRDYIDRGGFIFAEACCDGAEGFDSSFRAMCKKIFPPENQLRLLPPEHPIWHAEEPVPAEKQRTLMGIDYGCRTSVVYAPPRAANDPPNSLSCYWELASWRQPKYKTAVEEQIAAAKSIGINVLAYATNRELKTKEESFVSKAEKSLQDKIDRGKLSIAKLRHPGGCDTAPAALPNLLRTAARELKIRVETEQRLISITDPALFDNALVFMHGRRSFSLTAAEREALRTYIKRGGTLMADSICANKEFTASFRREMLAIFGGDPDVASKDQPLQPIPGKDPLYTKQYGGFDITTVSLREPQATGEDGRATALIRRIEPELEGVKIGDRYGVIFSKFDLSCALEKHDSLECEGYIRDDAERIGLNILLYALHQ